MVINYGKKESNPGRGPPRQADDGGKQNRAGGGARTVALRRTAPVVREPVALPPVMTVAELADEDRRPRQSRSSKS